MKKLLGISLIAAIVLGLSPLAFSMTITPYDSAANLANKLVGSGSGVTITNATYSGATVASGYFTGGTAAGLGINEGVVLTSGYASNLNGTSNTSDDITGANGQAGNALLNGLIPGYTTHDATVLSFDFSLSEDGNVYFNYAFGSEEYDEYVGSSFNDVFGFFVDGKNVALIPGTTTAVAINNVNNGLNASYYNDNDPDVGSSFPFEYDGFTDAFTAAITGLTAGTTYTITLAIGDAGDDVLDSGVFLQAGTFDTKPHPYVPEPATMFLLGSGLVGLAAFRKKFADN